jgi:predicted N-acyltransferase
MKRLLSKVGNFKALVLGNLLLTGENGYWTTLPAMRFEPLFLQTLKLMEQLAKQLGIGAMMVKDFFQRDLVVEAAGYHPLSFQPAMVLELPPEWKSFDDYIEAMSSKYRVRTRRAYKKGQSIDFKSLAIQEIELRNAELYELYLQVLDNADFNALTAHPDYFLQLKRHLKEDFDLVGCFIQQQLVGFFTTIRNHEELECHFIGLEASSNREHQVYLNMLYRMVEKGIQLGVHQISMARTALEIKSSVGAVAHQQFSYLRHRLPVLNHILPYVVRFMEPQEQWIPRHPFSKNETP